MKIYILMPTYNDGTSIIETLNSVIMQTYNNWYLIIVDDGSKDDTRQIVESFIKEKELMGKIKYIYQENADQLNAIKNGMKYIEEDNSLVYILHSDDLLTDKFVFEKAAKYFEKNNCDAILGDLDLIDGNSNNIGVQKIRKYKNSDDELALQTLWLGRQLYIDFAFWRKEVFFKKVFVNYLTWNMPYWLCVEDNNISMLNVEKVDFKFIKYRIFEGNYINNEVGVLNVLNGELRTLISLLKHFNVPNYKFQYFLYRSFNKLGLNYHVRYIKKESNDKYNIIKFAIEKRIKNNDLYKYPYYVSILNFYKNKNNRTIKLNNISNNDLFYGSDMRKFNNLMLKNELPDIYNVLFKEMSLGFDKVVVTKEDYEIVKNILKFMDIYYDVSIEIEK